MTSNPVSNNRERAIILSKDPPTAPTSTFSLHDALPISRADQPQSKGGHGTHGCLPVFQGGEQGSDGRSGLRADPAQGEDRKSTRLNSSHLGISYAVFCLKKKTDGAFLIILSLTVIDAIA